MNSTTRTKHPISSRHFRQIVCRPRALAEAMGFFFGVSWRPGDQSGSFLSQTLRPLGSPLMVAVHYEAAQVRGRSRTRVNLLGYKTEIEPFTGVVHFGGDDRNVFAYDFGLRPHVGARGRILDPKKNPSLGHLGLEIDKLVQNYAERSYSALTMPILPSVYLGFAAERLPEYEDTPGLRARVARHMRRSVTDIDAMPDDAVQPFLQAEWQSCFIKPGEGFNDTHLWLVSHELCSKASQALRIFECFEELLGAEIYNPARDLISPKKTIPNPARKVAKKLDIDIEQAVYGEEDGDDEKGIALEKGVREALGVNAALCSTQDIVDMLLNPDQHLVPSGVNDFKKMPDEQVVELMRGAAGRHAESCTDEDLLEAAQRPSRLLFAKGLCSVQVVRFDPANKPESLQFDETSLKRARTCLDVGSTRHYWTTGRKGGKQRRAVQPATPSA